MATGRVRRGVAVGICAVVAAITVCWSVFAVGSAVASQAGTAGAEDVQTASSADPAAHAAQIAFEIDRNRTIVSVKVGNSRPLRLILDTGMPMDGVYLFHKELLDGVDLDDSMEVLIPGAGGGEPSKGIMAESVPISAGEVVFGHQRAIVSLSDHTQGFPTDGVIGWSIFGHYAVELDYDEMVMTLHPPGTFSADGSWDGIPLLLRKSIPWLEASVDVVGDGPVLLDCYVDFASGEALELLARPDAKFPVPDSLGRTYLGTGLSGDVHGGRGRVAQLSIGPHSLSDVDAVFPDAHTRSRQEGADAVIGNRLLRRFYLVFDYDAETLWVRPNSAFGEPF